MDYTVVCLGQNHGTTPRQGRLVVPGNWEIMMKWSKWLENWDMTSLKINLKFLEMEWKPQVSDRAAAWDLYVELITRITTQALLPDDGDEATALESVHALFGLTRSTLKQHGRDCTEFSKIAIVVLNQVVRPFTARWHRRSVAGAFNDAAECQVFRAELGDLQVTLRAYTKMLADMAGVEDLTALQAD